MASSDLTFEEIYDYFKEKGGTVTNRDAVRYFKRYLTDPATKDDARAKFRKYVNILAHTKADGSEKILTLRTKYALSGFPSPPFTASPPPPQYDPRNSIGIPTVPAHAFETSPSTSPRQPPPYRPPPPPVSSPNKSFDSVSLCSSSLSLTEPSTPQAPPRRKSGEKGRLPEDVEKAAIAAASKENDAGEESEKQPISVKERTQKFNRMASVDDELSPSPKQNRDGGRKRVEKGAEQDDGVSDTSLEPKKCQEWYVCASKCDYSGLLRLIKDEPRLASLKDPFTYTILHWAAKHGNENIIKLFAGKYKLNVNAKTRGGGYTPLHLAAQFGRKEVYDILVSVYKADKNVRDFSGHKPIYYKTSSLEKNKDANKNKGRKKHSDRDMGFLRIGSLNVRVKKTTEAFSNFLGVGSGSVINPVDALQEKIHKGWGSADNVAQENMPAPKGYNKRKTKRPVELTGTSSTPSTPKQLTRGINRRASYQDSDSDTAAGFDSKWTY